MKATLSAGMEHARRIQVDEWRTIAFLGDDCRVYATPFVLYDVEVASQELMDKSLEDNEDSVGISATISHMAATPLGMWVDVKVKVTALDGRKVEFEFECRDDAGTIARGVHQRFIVNRNKTADQIRQKSAQYL